ncbi:MAG: hypothetical protein KAI47_08290 [Deltaproteobacteria bacterium]|nr:hypothetical protein [Deltaproteobacteria bacterium]
MRGIVLLSLCVFLSMSALECTKKSITVDTTKATARCRKWAKLLHAPKGETPDKCLIGMRKLAAAYPTRYVCGNKCIDAASDVKSLMTCMASCKAP